MKSKHFALILIIISAILISGCTAPETDDSEICTKAGTGESMTFDKAKTIAQASVCGAQGNLKDTYMCNDVTGTWWIDLDIEQPGCNPACVINVVTEEAEINWRCTGLLE
ncbi:MAG: hypothetical protein KAS90_01625 [Candidatus Aenigmarchaeota archaeon]|nr:hypothetical protein [Candidatus Aenigmarchaeota archaeon]